MNPKDFFYLEKFDEHFIDNFHNSLIEKEILKKHYTESNIHYFDIQIEIDEKFIFENFQTYNINDITLKRLSEVCIRDIITLQPISDLLNSVRTRSDYYPVLRNTKVFLKHEYDEIIERRNL